MRKIKGRLRWLDRQLVSHIEGAVLVRRLAPAVSYPFRASSRMDWPVRCESYCLECMFGGSIKVVREHWVKNVYVAWKSLIYATCLDQQ